MYDAEIMGETTEKRFSPEGFSVTEYYPVRVEGFEQSPFDSAIHIAGQHFDNWNFADTNHNVDFSKLTNRATSLLARDYGAHLYVYEAPPNPTQKIIDAVQSRFWQKPAFTEDEFLGNIGEAYEIAEEVFNSLSNEETILYEIEAGRFLYADSIQSQLRERSMLGTAIICAQDGVRMQAGDFDENRLAAREAERKGDDTELNEIFIKRLLADNDLLNDLPQTGVIKWFGLAHFTKGNPNNFGYNSSDNIPDYDDKTPNEITIAFIDENHDTEDLYFPPIRYRQEVVEAAKENRPINASFVSMGKAPDLPDILLITTGEGKNITISEYYMLGDFMQKMAKKGMEFKDVDNSIVIVNKPPIESVSLSMESIKPSDIIPRAMPADVPKAIPVER